MGVCVCVRRNACLVCLGAVSTLVLVGCTLAGGMLDVLWLKQNDDE